MCNVSAKSDFLDRIAVPVGLLLVFGGFLLLVCWAYARDLSAALDQSSQDSARVDPTPTTLVALQIFDWSAGVGPPLSVRLAALLADRLTSDRASALRRAAYAVLLQRPRFQARLPGLALSRARFGELDGRPVLGLRRAARVHFGIDVEELSLGESLLLLHLALEPAVEASEPDQTTALEIRNELLERGRDAGIIPDGLYEMEISQPLSWASDHRPIR